MIKWLLVFTATVTADWMWARWAYASAHNRPVHASAYSAGIILCSGFTIVEYAADPWLLIPACAGAALGTYIAVRGAI